MDLELEQKVKDCLPCQLCQETPPPQAPLHPWEWPSRPWALLHLDYAEPFIGKVFLVTVDAHSKWPDVHSVSAATSSTTVTHLQTFFATHGPPETRVTDNACICFSIHQCRIPRIHHWEWHSSLCLCLLSSSFERVGRTSSADLQSSNEEARDGPLEDKLACLLFRYHITPYATAGETPAKLLMGRQLRGHLSQLHPGLEHKLGKAQGRQREQHGRGTWERDFRKGNSGFLCNYGRSDRWVPGSVVQKKDQSSISTTSNGEW